CRAEWSGASTRRAPSCPNSPAHEDRADCSSDFAPQRSDSRSTARIVGVHPFLRGRGYRRGKDVRRATAQRMTDEEAQGGRVFFTSTGRSLVDEDEIVVLSVGVDIGSSTSHLVFSRIVLERLDSRYVVTTRETFYQSDILLTPYCAEEEID